MDKGWIKLHRKLNESDMYKGLNSVQRDVLIQCLLMANHTEKEWEWKGKIIKCQPGQFKTSLESIRKNCAKRTTIKMVRTALKKLEKWKFLANEGAKEGRIITICKWRTYQHNSQSEGKDEGKIGADVGQDKGMIRATNKNGKNVKNDKNSTLSSLQDGDIKKLFDELNKILHKVRPCKKSKEYYDKIKTRLRTYTSNELIQAAQNLANDPFMSGDNENQKKYASLEYLVRNDKNVQKWLEEQHKPKRRFL